MFYYKAKDGMSYLGFFQELTVDNYPEYTEEMIAQYDSITEQEWNAHFDQMYETNEEE